MKLFAFDFGRADDGRDIGHEIRTRMWPSLAIALPVFLVGLAVYITFALLMAFFRATYLDFWGVVLCVAMMSISALFYIIGGQYLVSKLWHLVPISGFGGGLDASKFLVLPVVIGVVARHRAAARAGTAPSSSRRSARTTCAPRAPRGCRSGACCSATCCRTRMIPILTGVVVVIPLLFMGSLMTESFFGIPGLGSYTIDAIHAQDFAVVRAMVFLGSVLYIVGLLADRHLLHAGRSAGEVRMMPSSVLWTDALVWLLVAVSDRLFRSMSAATSICGAVAACGAQPAPAWRRSSVLARVRRRRAARFAAFPARARAAGPARAARVVRRRGAVAARRAASRRCETRTEKTYSAPLAAHRFCEGDGRTRPDGASACASIPRLRLRRGAPARIEPDRGPRHRARRAAGVGLARSRRVWLVVDARPRSCAQRAAARRSARCGARSGGGATDVPWRAMLITGGLLLLIAGPVDRCCAGKLPRPRHRQGRAGRALSGAQEHPHRARDRHAHHARACCRSRCCSASWPATSAAGSTTSSSTSTPRSIRSRACC